MLTERLTVNPEILGGKPIIKGTRMTVEFILELLASGIAEDEVLRDYPHLTREDIQACLSYAAHALRNEIYLDLKKAS
ncbi:MAG: antitoxin [Desulfuromonadales bacterium GWD2_61_12]|nr:MAG: antitoxin [Desulfuromonadales bacterium GWD2_61_12]HAD03464.1 antitoxin [Desulfuromonas sp.]HBT82585.1 antitoxin [Desulfuromonas sp.]